MCIFRAMAHLALLSSIEGQEPTCKRDCCRILAFQLELIHDQLPLAVPCSCVYLCFHRTWTISSSDTTFVVHAPQRLRVYDCTNANTCKHQPQKWCRSHRFILVLSRLTCSWHQVSSSVHTRNPVSTGLRESHIHPSLYASEGRIYGRITLRKLL
jgi:hypothetical protein